MNVLSIAVTKQVMAQRFTPPEIIHKNTRVTQCCTTHMKGIQNVNVDVCVLESKLGARGSIQSKLYFYKHIRVREMEKESKSTR